MTVKVNLEAIQELFSDPEGPVAKIIERKAYNVENAAKALLLIPGSGRVYEPGNYFLNRDGKILHWERTTTHQASAPGESPASDTGSLLNSLSHEMHVGSTVYATVGSPLKYAIWLEEGTRYMAPRPFLKPALDIGMAL